MAKKENVELFPQELAATIRDGLKHGVTDQMMVEGMISVGNLLEHFIRPDTPEEALIKEIWDMADEEEKRVIAGIVLRIGKKRIH